MLLIGQDCLILGFNRTKYISIIYFILFRLARHVESRREPRPEGRSDRRRWTGRPPSRNDEGQVHQEVVLHQVHVVQKSLNEYYY
jgi:hypothetical protein